MMRLISERYNASVACRRLYDELSAFTLSLGDKDFIHQTVVDTYAAQHSGPNMKAITTAFALIGLYPAFERGYTGKEVQRPHMVLGRTRRQWPRFGLPEKRGEMTVLNVLQGLTGENYQKRINDWGKSVWLQWSPEHANVSKLVGTYLNA